MIVGLILVGFVALLSLIGTATRPDPLPPLPRTFGEFVRDQRPLIARDVRPFSNSDELATIYNRAAVRLATNARSGR